uniref:hillarin n=1 Tax=Ciona intestinalis TaxID=7719 RepID=UPI000180AFD3|nr:hillarin [Ciona intestinalis]XP_026693621.1 hillarin [Ciona intestinalis]|eukprot:XP_026693620.1 hillarin [Ciona intestinalis]
MGCGSSKVNEQQLPKIVVTPDVKRKYVGGGAILPQPPILPETILPHPVPPTTTKNEVLAGIGGKLTSLDKHADKTSIKEASNNVDDFTSGIFSEFNNRIVNGEVPKLPTIHEKGGLSSISKPSAVDKNAMLERLLRQQEAEEKMRTLDKDRQQNNLQDKLMERMKRKKSQQVVNNVTTVDSGDPIMNSGDLSLNLGLDQAPKPQAPVTKKEALYMKENISLFRDLETYAVNMERVDSTLFTFNKLMTDLLIEQLTDLEKVRILFHWITSQDLNAIKFPSEIPDDTPLGYLHSIKQDTKTYAALFLRLCRAAGIHCKQISGYLKGVGYQPDYKFRGKDDPFRGSWNGVLVDGQWRLIDTHWGARHVTEDDEIASNNWRTEYKYEEHYFLTDPDQLIATHFPDEPEWQLLPKVYSLTDFESTAKLWPLFYKLKLSLLSHGGGVVSTDNRGFVRIKLGVPSFARSEAKFKVELRTRNRQKEINGISLQQYIFHYSLANEEVVEAYVPTPGTFLLKIFGLSKKYSEDNLFTNCCLYQINCDVVKRGNYDVTPPFPKVTSYYGPGLLSQQCGIETLSHNGPIVDCDVSGVAEVVVRLPSNGDVTFTQDLHDATSANPLPDHSFHSIHVNGGWCEVTFLALPPSNGCYTLTLYISTNNDGKYSSFCHYLVNSKVARGEVFPAVPNCRVGDIGASLVGMKLVSSCPADIKDVTSGFVSNLIHGDLTITFNHAEPLLIIANLSTTNDETSEVLIETSGFSSTLVVRPPIKWNQNFVLLKVYAARIDKTQNIPSVFNVLMKFEKDSITPTPLHHPPTHIWGPNPMFHQLGVKAVTYDNTSPYLPTYPLNSPRRLYNGGKDMTINLTLVQPLQLRSKLMKLNGNPQPCEDMSFVRTSQQSNAHICTRFSEPGDYSLVVYGANMADDGQQLSPILYTFISATTSSSCIQAYPSSQGMWVRSVCHLTSPMVGTIMRGEEHPVCFKIGGWRDGVVMSYPVVMMLVDGQHEVEPDVHNDIEYEYKYHPSPADKVVGIVVKVDETSQSMSYVLQFKIA